MHGKKWSFFKHRSTPLHVRQVKLADHNRRRESREGREVDGGRLFPRTRTASFEPSLLSNSSNLRRQHDRTPLQCLAFGPIIRSTSQNIRKLRRWVYSVCTKYEVLLSKKYSKCIICSTYGCIYGYDDKYPWIDGSENPKLHALENSLARRR